MAMDVAAPEKVKRIRFGLSARVLALTLLFATLAEILIYLPALSYYRRSLLMDRVSAAHVAALILDPSVGDPISREQEMEILRGVGGKQITYGAKGVRTVLADGTNNPQISSNVDMRDRSWGALLRGTFDDFLYGSTGNIRLIANAPGLDFVEIVMERAPLQRDLLVFSRIFLGYFLFIALVVAGLLYWALQWLVVEPVRRLALNVADFAGHPEDISRIIRPSGRGDEIGLAEEALAKMEGSLAEALRKKRRLAELGLAISKINHELRNILTTAQLLTDRLEGVSDKVVQRVAPRLVGVLGRAISFCQATLAYGRAQEKEPQREVFPLAELLTDIEELAGLTPDSDIAIEKAFSANLSVDADKEQLTRVIVNLVRNSAQALSTQTDETTTRIILISAQQTALSTVILVADNGPGVPEAMQANLFMPFHTDKSGKTGNFSGTGLGLVISAELVLAHGGTLSLDEVPSGACFRIVIPVRTVKRVS